MVDPQEPYAYDTSMVNMGPQYQVPNPELGPLERRVDKTFLEALFSDEVNLDDTNYWFEEPEGPCLPFLLPISHIALPKSWSEDFGAPSPPSSFNPSHSILTN